MRRGDRRVVRELALHGEHGGDAVGPLSLHGAEDPDLVVDEDVARSRVASLDILELVFLVDVDEDVVRDVANAGSSDLARLEDRVTVREDDHGSGSPQAREDLECSRVQAVGVRVLEEELGEAEESWIHARRRPPLLHGTDVVPVSSSAKRRSWIVQ